MKLPQEKLSAVYEYLKEQAYKISDDSETQVGAGFLRKDGSLLPYTAYNTHVSDSPEDIPRTRPEKHQYMIHAEVNLILRWFREKDSRHTNTVFCTLSPCPNCLRIMYNAGIRHVYFKEMHSTFSDQLRDIKIELEKVEEFTYLKMQN